MTSMPASRSARAMILAPRSCPSRPGLATTTRIFLLMGARGYPVPRYPEQQEEPAEDEECARVEPAVRERRALIRPGRLASAAAGRAVRPARGAGAVPSAGLRRPHEDRAVHERVRRADVGVRAGLVEGVRAAPAVLEDAGVERPVRRGGRVRRGPLLAQVTVSPWSMVIVPGVKLKSAMVTEPLAAATAFGSGVRLPAPSSARNVGSGGAVAGAAGAAGAGSAG